MASKKFLFVALVVVSVAGYGQKNAHQVASQAPVIAEKPVALTVSATVDAPKKSPILSSGQPHNAMPFGLEIGVANIEGIRETLGPQTKLEPRGLNQYSGGMMLSSNGAGLGMDGLAETMFIFDRAGILSGVVMTMPKDPVAMLKKLSAKYTPVSDKVDRFMNYGYARLKKGASVIEIDAPHLSFTMQVRYATQKLISDFSRMRADAEARKELEQSSKL